MAVGNAVRFLFLLQLGWGMVGPGEAAGCPLGSRRSACPPFWLEYAGSCYRAFSHIAKGFPDCEDFCKAHTLPGQLAHLVSIHSDAESEVVASLAAAADGTKGYWIGYRRTTGDFFWQDESPADYTNWKDGQPNSSKPCAVIYTSYNWQWVTNSYTTSNHPMCKMPIKEQ